VGIFFRHKVITVAYACLGAFVFSCYIIYDTQLMMGGKHKYSINPGMNPMNLFYSIGALAGQCFSHASIFSQDMSLHGKDILTVKVGL
jgi:FtsH-binding integral membrane protein